MNSVPSIKDLDAPLLEGIKEYEELKEISAQIKVSLDKYKTTLEQLKSELSDWNWSDKISNLYTIQVHIEVCKHCGAHDPIG